MNDLTRICSAQKKYLLLRLFQLRDEQARDPAIPRLGIVPGHIQARRQPRVAGPPRPPDAMYIRVELIRCVGQVDVYYVLDAGYVEPPRCDVRGHQDQDLALAELGQGRLALGLGPVAVYVLRLHGGEALVRPALPGPAARQLLLEFGRIPLLLDEDERPALGPLLQRLDRELQLVGAPARGQEHDLLDRVGRGAHASDGDPRVVRAEELPGQLLYRRGERSRKQKGLTPRRRRHARPLDEAADLRLEAWEKDLPLC